MDNELLQFTMEFRDMVSKELDNVNDKLEEMEKNFDGTGKSADKTGKSVDETGKKSKKTGGVFKEVAKTAAKFGGALAALGAAGKAIGFGKSVIAEGMDFEKTMSSVRAMTGATGNDFQALEAEARRLGATTSKSAKDAADAQVLLAQAGFSVNEILDANEDILYLSISANMDMAQAADIAAGAMNGFGLEASDMARVTDVLAKGSITAATDVEGLGSALSYVAPTANAMGHSIEETTGVLAALADANIKGSRGGTTLNNVLAQLGNSSSTAVKELNKMGISYDKLDPKTNSMADVVGHLADAGFESSDAMRIFGQEAGPGMAVLLEKGKEGLDELTKTMENAEGSAKELSEVMADNLQGDLDGLSSAWSEVKLTLYEGVAGDVFRPFVQGITDVVQKIPAFLEGIGSMFGAIKNAAGGGEFFATVMNLMRQGMEILQPSFEVLGGIALSAKDILVEAFTILWGILQPILSNLGVILLSVGQVIGTVFMNIAVPLIQLFWAQVQNMWGIVGPIFELLGSVIQVAFSILQTVWTTIAAPFITFLSGAFKAAFDFVIPVVEKLGGAFDFVGGIIQKVSGWFGDLAGKISNFKVPGWISKIGGKIGLSVGVDGSHATGLYNVPHDSYVSELHRGESVLTAPQSEFLRDTGILTAQGDKPVLNVDALRSSDNVSNVTNSSVSKTSTSSVTIPNVTIHVSGAGEPVNVARAVRDELKLMIKQTAAVTGM